MKIVQLPHPIKIVSKPHQDINESNSLNRLFSDKIKESDLTSLPEEMYFYRGADDWNAAPITNYKPDGILKTGTLRRSCDTGFGGAFFDDGTAKMGSAYGLFDYWKGISRNAKVGTRNLDNDKNLTDKEKEWVLENRKEFFDEPLWNASGFWTKHGRGKIITLTHLYIYDENEL